MDAFQLKHDLEPCWRHYAGHPFGLRSHEGSFLDHGDKTALKPGIIFAIEPGLYALDIGGFRHSDMVLVTEGAAELMTFYPRNFASMIIPV